MPRTARKNLTCAISFSAISLMISTTLLVNGVEGPPSLVPPFGVRDDIAVSALLEPAQSEGDCV